VGSALSIPGATVIPSDKQRLWEEALEEGLRFQRAGLNGRAAATLEPLLGADVPSDVQSRAHCLLSIVTRIQGEWQLSLEHSRQAVEAARRGGHTSLIAEALNAEGACWWQRGDLQRAESLFRSVLEHIGECDMKCRGLALCNLGSLAGDANRWEEAGEYFVCARECFRLAGHRQGEMVAEHNYARVLFGLGRYSEAVVAFGALGLAAEQEGDAELVALAASNLAEAIARGGDPDASIRFAGQAIGAFDHGGNHYRKCVTLGVFAQVAKLQGDADLALRSYRRAIEEARTRGFEDLVLRLQKEMAGVDTI
jgi:tetratricopeptide (TPR) repeat protein